MIKPKDMHTIVKGNIITQDEVDFYEITLCHNGAGFRYWEARKIDDPVKDNFHFLTVGQLAEFKLFAKDKIMLEVLFNDS